MDFCSHFNWKWFGRKVESVSTKYLWLIWSVFFLVGLLREADTWALSTLQASGLQCSSCGSQSNKDFYEKCMKECLDILDTNMGFLTGPAFTFSSVIASLPLGWLADRYSRVWILFFGVLVWSISTIVSGFATQFWQLALARIALGLGGATVNPTVYSMLSDFFPFHKRAFILAAFTGNIFFGQFFGLLSGFISQTYSWRIAFIGLGLPGILVALILIIVIPEPVRGMNDTEFSSESNEQIERLSVFSKILILCRLPAFVSLCITSTIRNMGGYALGAWFQVFLVRVHKLQPSQYVGWLMFIIPVAGCLSAGSGGWLADKLHEKTVGGKPLLIGCAQILAVPFIAACLLVPDYRACLVLLFPSYIFAEMYFGPAAAIVQDLIPPSFRGLGTAFYFIVISLGALSPLIVGALNQCFNIVEQGENPDAYDPTYSLLIVVPGTYLLSSVGFLITSFLCRSHSYYLSKLLQNEKEDRPLLRSQSKNENENEQ